MVLINILITLTVAFNSPAYKSIVKETVLGERINAYNSILNGLTEIMRIYSPLLAALMVQHWGGRISLLVNGLTFIFSAFVEVFVHTDRQKIESKASLKNSVVSDLIDGLKYLHSEKKIQRVVLISSLTNFFLAGYNLFLPFLNTLMQNPNVYSIALSFQAIGGIFGSFLNIHAKKVGEVCFNSSFICMRI